MYLLLILENLVFGSNVNGWLDLKNKLNQELEKCFEQQYITKDKAAIKDWINNSLENNLIVPNTILRKIVSNSKTYKGLVKEISLKAQNKFIKLKKNILKNYNSETRNKIKILLDIIEHQIMLANNILRYPNRKILENSLNDLRNIIPKESFDNINKLIENLKNIYFILRYPLEIVNQIQAIDYLNRLNLKNIKNIKINHIMSLHKILLKDIDDNFAGVFREGPCNVDSFYDDFPEADEIHNSLNDYINWIQTSNIQDIISLAAEIHLKFLFIHPFVDGNGRIARFLMNCVLTQNNYSPFTISKFEPTYNDYYMIVGEIHKTNNNVKFKEFLLKMFNS